MRRSTGFALIILSALVICGCTYRMPNDTREYAYDTLAADESDESAKSDSEITGDALTVVCLGDSVTAGVFELLPSDYYFIGYQYDPEAAYPALLEATLGDMGYNTEVINAGISGDTVEQGINRLSSDVFTYKPDIITVCFGLNDVCYYDPEWYADNLSTLFSLILDFDEKIDIVFMTPNMLADHVNEDIPAGTLNYSMALGNVEITDSGALDEYMDAAYEVCERYGVPVCDAYSYWTRLYDEGEDITNLLASHVTHPVRSMHRVFADMLTETMKNNDIIG